MSDFLRAIYDGSPMLRYVTTTVRTLKWARIARKYRPPFTRDAFLTEAIDTLIRDNGIRTFVETGTYLADTTRYVAARHPHVSILTVEAHPVYFGASRAVLKRHGNVEQLLGSSADVLNSLLVEGRIPERSLLFLDAHWNDYLPLPREMQLLGTLRQDAIFVIHDFKVPAQPHFRFDVYHERAIGLDMVREAQQPNRTYRVLLPNYQPDEVYGSRANEMPAMRGHAIVFQGMHDAFDRFRTTTAGARYIECR